MPIAIFVFCGLRASVVPLVTETLNWDHGVFLGGTAASETTAANIAEVGSLPYDPFAIIPFCGHNMAGYFHHWFDLSNRLADGAPRIFYVNWFRTSRNGEWLWPASGHNSRVLKWMCERVDNKAGVKETPIGFCQLRATLN